MNCKNEVHVRWLGQLHISIGRITWIEIRSNGRKKDLPMTMSMVTGRYLITVYDSPIFRLRILLVYVFLLMTLFNVAICRNNMRNGVYAWPWKWYSPSCQDVHISTVDCLISHIGRPCKCMVESSVDSPPEGRPVSVDLEAGPVLIWRPGFGSEVGNLASDKRGGFLLLLPSTTHDIQQT
jgi:hypothetical protein